MTAFALPRRRQSNAAKVAKSAAKAWTAMKIGSVAGRTARKTAKWYGSWKVAKFLGRRGPKLLLVPVAAGGGVAAWKRLRSSSSSPPQPSYGAPQGPAATSATVTPPQSAQDRAGTMNGEGATSDSPAGTVTSPPGATS
jgi:hypothetical protein